MGAAEFGRQIIEAMGAGVYNDNTTTPNDIINALETSDYDRLRQYYQTYQNWDHILMSEHYRKSIARITQEFDTVVAVTGNPLQFYMDLAWRGLRSEVPSWFDYPLTERARINNVIDDYTGNNMNQSCN